VDARLWHAAVREAARGNQSTSTDRSIEAALKSGCHVCAVRSDFLYERARNGRAGTGQDEEADMRIVIIGANGGTGRQLAQQALEVGHLTLCHQPPHLGGTSSGNGAPGLDGQ
jgi:hypothetical protein